jgi:hypothetical protein
MKMRTAIALLVKDEFSNRLASFTLRCRDYGYNLNVLRLPAHVSLKQPFVVNDFERFERYFEEFARQTESRQLKLDGFLFWGNADQGVVAVSSRLAMFIYGESTRPDPLYGVREYGTFKE